MKLKKKTIENLASVYADELAGEIYEVLSERFADVIRTVLKLVEAGDSADEIVEKAIEQYDAQRDAEEDAEEDPETSEKIEELRKVREELKKRGLDDTVDVTDVFINGGDPDLTKEDAVEIAKFIEALLRKRKAKKVKVTTE